MNTTYLTYFNNDIQYGSKYIIKRFVDNIFSLSMLITLLPLFVLISIFISRRDGYPFIVSQKRIGLHGNEFKMYKFRTMYVDSHKKRESLEELNKHDEVIFKLDDDPRIHKGGEILRQYSLDELPQLWSILLGQMSFVGPRPALYNQNDLIQLRTEIGIHKLKPGITGWAQVNGRDELSIEEKVGFELDYLHERSFSFDMYIIWLTIKRVMFKEGISH